MAEIPANAILVDEFAALFDGFSIGSNDRSQLVLGVDRDKVGICGQAPSDYPDMVRFLVGKGITSISLNPDAVVRGLEAVAAAEAARLTTA